MDLNPYVSSLTSSLVATAQSSSQEVREAAERLAQGMEPAVRLSLMEMASDVAAEVTSRLDGEVVDVRLRGGNPEIVVDRSGTADAQPTVPFGAPEPPQPPGPPQPPADDEGGTSRISLRLPEYLKSQVDEAAAAEGVSANTWLVRAVQSALTPGHSGIDITTPGGRVRIGRSMTGWAR